MSWYHNYRPTSAVAAPWSAMHVPAFFDPSYLTAPNIAAAIASPSPAVLTFNEPDGAPPGGSNITPATALANWHQFELMGKRIGAPPTAQSNANGAWITTFMAGPVPETGLPPQVDFMTVHKYLTPGQSLASKLATLFTYLDAIYAAWHRPIWLTEVNIITFNGAFPNWTFGSQQEAIDLMGSLPGECAKRGYIERLCPYPLTISNAIATAAPNYLNIILANLSDASLTPVGVAYRDNIVLRP